MHDRTHRFLCLCLRAWGDPHARDAVRELAADPDLDWESVSDAAVAERVGPLLHHVLRELHGVPPVIQQRLHAVYRSTSFRNLVLLTELATVSRRLAAEQVRLIVLKGMALADAVYRHVGLRPSLDLDVLVRQAELPVVLRVIEALGYRSSEPETRTGAVLAYENELILRKPGSIEVELDLHWGLFDSPYHQQAVDMEWFWKTAVPLPGDGHALMLGPEAQILHLCGHLVLHHSGEGLGLLRLHDVAAVIGVYGERIDWQLLLDRAQTCGLVLPLQQVLGRVADEWGAPIAPTVLDRLGALRPSRHETRVFARLTGERQPGRRFWADLASTTAWRQRLGYALSAVFPSPAYMRRRYRISHPVLLPFYYPYRWLRGLRSSV